MVWSIHVQFAKHNNGTPLQYSCLGSPMDGGAWWATVHGVAPSDTTEQRTLHFTCPFPGILRSATRHPPTPPVLLFSVA